MLCAFDLFERSTDRAALLVDRSSAQQSVDGAAIDRSCTRPVLRYLCYRTLLWCRMPRLLLPLHTAVV